MLFSRNQQPIIRFIIRILPLWFTEQYGIRIACGRTSFELNANCLNSISMRILIRIRVDRP